MLQIKTLPAWFKRKVPTDPTYDRVRMLLERLQLNTVCKEAKCPNVGECYSRGTATFMVLGDVCTRNCRFCAIDLGKPRAVDPDEPKRLAEAVATLNLKHVVITMVTRDDLKDGGSAHVAEVVRVVKALNMCTVEVLTSDFRGREESVYEVVDAGPDIFNHNVETVPSLYKTVRPMMDYKRSLQVLKWVKDYRPEVITKSGFMLGFGEADSEVETVLQDLLDYRCDAVTIGQYLKPPDSSLEVVDYVGPDVFKAWKMKAEAMGFLHVESGPLVRSSYRADEAVRRYQKTASGD